MRLFADASFLLSAARFPEEAFFVVFRATYANPNYTAKANVTDAPTEANTERHMCRSLQQKPGRCLDPNLDGSSFFLPDPEILINNERVEGPKLYEFGSVYQAVNRAFTTDEFCQRKYGRKLARIRTTADRMATAANDMSQRLKEASRTLDFDSYGTSQAVLLRFSFDGYWPFCSQSNIVAALMGDRAKEVPNAYLRPLSSLTVRLTKRLPIDAMVMSTTVTDAEYWADGPVDAAKKPPALEIEILEMGIYYDSYVPDGGQTIPRVGRGTLGCYWDYVHFSYQDEMPGQKETRHQFPIPPGARSVTVGWMHQSQGWYDESKNKNIHCMFRFPPGGKECRLKLPDRELEFEDGLKDFGVAEAVSSPSCRMYHARLVQKKLFDGPFEDLWPRGFPNKLSYCQVLIADLTDIAIPDDTKLEVFVQYDTALSPKGYVTFAFYEQQKLKRQDEQLKFKDRVIAP
jgi:hypothetical protein